MNLYRIEPDKGMTWLGSHQPEQGRKLALDLSRENFGIEYVLDQGTYAESYVNGECRGQMLSSTRRRA